MILLDTNVLVYAFDPESAFCDWARDIIADAVAGEGAAINAVSLAELCVGDEDPLTVGDRIRTWGVAILDVPASAAEICAQASVTIANNVHPSPVNPPLPCPFLASSLALML